MASSGGESRQRAANPRLRAANRASGRRMASFGGESRQRAANRASGDESPMAGRDSWALDANSPAGACQPNVNA
jgi:hypothetical protein